ncbi:lytic transglycosylase domain-containing protein [Pseudomonas syringae]|nr:lytic transglycosylase domain-containing protein [Pseudomonas syringae]
MIELIPLLLSCAATVHPDTVRDVAKVESSMNPYAIGVVGSNGLMPNTKEDALLKINQLEREGRNYSVGLMQINRSNFLKYGVTPERLLDPCTNLSVFEKVMTDCYVRGKTLPRALSCYYSGNFEAGAREEKAFSDSSYVQRIGYDAENRYVVPSTKADKEKFALGQRHDSDRAKNSTKSARVRIVYPEGVLKSTLIVDDKPTKILRGVD